MPITVRLDDRLRLAGALLAASDWPEHEQAVKAYKAHRVADAAHKALSAHHAHPAVQTVRALAGHGEGLDRLYAHALNGDWPDGLAVPVADFAAVADLAGFYAGHAADWAQAEAEARAVLARADLGQFLADLAGPQTRAFVFVPNLLFPGRQRVACASPAEVVVASHPPIAWGTSHPWRFDERPDESLALISEAFARFLFAQAGLAERAEALGAAAAVLFLREAEGQAAGDQYMVMEKKARGLKTLPAAVAALEPVLAARRAGNYSHGIADYAAGLSF